MYLQLNSKTEGPMLVNMDYVKYVTQAIGGCSMLTFMNSATITVREGMQEIELWLNPANINH